MKNKSTNQRGYTIVETMIAVSIFLIIVVIGIGALLNANLLHQKSRDMRSIMDNLSFIMEDMSRNLRTGYNYRCITFNDGTSASDLSSSNVGTAKSGQGCWGIAFEAANGGPNYNDDQWVYYFDGNSKRVNRLIQGPYMTTADYIQLTPDEVKIDPVLSSFTIVGAEPPSSGNSEQPFVTIRLVGNITFKNVVTPFSLQTSVSQRLVDI